MTDGRVDIVGTPLHRKKPAKHVYSAYGIALESDVPLPLPAHVSGELARIQLHTASAPFFADALRGIALERLSGRWYQFARLPDGSSYVCWRTVGEFIVAADGKGIVCRRFDEATPDSFHVYLLGQALSFALVKSGFEPFHATAVVIDGGAVAFFGSSGFGKSSLAASFLGAGYSLLTDDLLLLQSTGDRVLAYPGPGRIKLFRKSAYRFMAEAGAGVRMNSGSEKLILGLNHAQRCATPIPLRAMYSLAAPREVSQTRGIRIETLPPRNVFLELAKNTFNYRVLGADRLKRQFDETARLVNLVPFQKLFFPRTWDVLPSVREAIMLNLNRQVMEIAVCAD